jgi:hypothetical protein
MAATGAHTATIYRVQLTGPYVGTCGPGPVPLQIESGGQIVSNDVALRGGCTVNIDVLTTPAISVAP